MAQDFCLCVWKVRFGTFACVSLLFNVVIFVAVIIIAAARETMVQVLLFVCVCMLLFDAYMLLRWGTGTEKKWARFVAVNACMGLPRT